MAFVKFWHGTAIQYGNITTKDSNTLYFITDTGKIYKGTDEIANKTSKANHYTPTADTGSAISQNASSSTAATWNSTSLVTGVNISRDSKGHITDMTLDSIKMPANPHIVGKNIVGDSDDTANTTTTLANGNVYLKHVEGTDVKSSHKISGTGKVTVKTDTSGNIVIDGAKTTLAELGLGSAVHFLGTSTTAITDGGKEIPTISGWSGTVAAGDIVIYDNKEFIWTASGTWELFGDEGNYVLKDRKITAGAGIAVNDSTEATLEGDIVIKNTGVTSITQGTVNGTIAVSVGGGTASNVSVTGLAAAAYKSVSDSTSAAALSTGTNLVTERDVYYGLASINGSRQTSNVSVYAPTATGTADQVLISTGSTTKTPTWATLDELESVKSLKAALTWETAAQ